MPMCSATRMEAMLVCFIVGIHAPKGRVPKGVVDAFCGGLCGVAAALLSPVDVVADFRLHAAVDMLHRDAAVPDEAAGGFEYDGPQPKTVSAVVFQIPMDPST